jgi:biopolymer transport protein ExbB/TolQ
MQWLALLVSVLFGLWTIGVILDRQLALRTAHRQSQAYVAECVSLLRNANTKAALVVSKRFSKSHLAKVAVCGLAIFEDYGNSESIDFVTKKAERAMTNATQIVTVELRRGLGGLEAIGAVSPIFALLYSREAATIIGALVTAPAIGFGIHFRHRITRYEAEMKGINAELTDCFENIKKTGYGYSSTAGPY